MSNNPIIETSIKDINPTTIALTGDSSVLVRYYSTARAKMYPEAQGGASIYEDMCIIRNGSETAYASMYDFENVESDVFKFSAEDSEGRVTQETVYADMIDYIKLTCNITNVKINADGSAVLNCEGDYFGDGFGEEENYITVQCRYRLSGGTWSDYVSMTVDAGGTGYEAYANFTGLDYSQSYDFECIAQDALRSVSDRTYRTTSKPVFHWSGGDVAFEVPVSIAGKTTIGGDADIKGNLRLKGDGNYGNILYFGDNSYCYIGELKDDEMYVYADVFEVDVENEIQLKAAEIALTADALTLNGDSIESGEWTPSVDGNGMEYTTRYGYYSKVGKVVTVGFYIKAAGDEYLEDLNISISGLPYTPLHQGSGGGICSGVLMNGNMNFQCFVAETNGTITLRGQMCDDMSGYTLTTSAQACRVPNGEFTLSGTITYMIA